MITDRPAVDWLTVTTYDLRKSMECDAIIHSMTGDSDTWERDIDGYVGREGNGFFVGEGEQNGHKHFMFRIHGSLADRFMFHPLAPTMDCTRIDLQLTLAWTQGNPFHSFYRDTPLFNAHEATKQQRARKCKPLLDDDGFCTMYVGSKKSNRMYRIYIKGETDNLFIRFEVVYKGKKGLGGQVYKRVRENPPIMTTYLAGEVATLYRKAGIVRPFAEFLDGIKGDVLPAGRERPTPHATLNWIVRQVMPAFKRVLGNEDTRFTAYIVLQDLFEFWEKLEK